MRRRSRAVVFLVTWSILAIAGIVGACGGGQAPPASPPSSALRPAGPTTLVANRVLARLTDPNAPCPTKVPGVGGAWVPSHVFARALERQLPASMRDLCAYDWSSPTTKPDMSAIRGLNGVDSVAVDPPIVVTLTDVTADMANRRLKRRASLREQTYGVDGFPTGFKNVLVGYPDTSPSNAAKSGNIMLGSNPHGFNVAWVTRYLTCSVGGGPCLTTPFMELALGRSTPTAAPTAAGGSYSTLGEFATSIDRLVERWKRGPEKMPLVLNLSAGWEPELGCLDTQLKAARPESQQPQNGMDITYPLGSCAGRRRVTMGEEAVFAALTNAACQGALIIAAAGNDMGYSPPRKGPMLPAAWEQVELRCDALGKSSLGLAGAYRPLVHAVGGIDGDNLPIATSRQSARSQLVAPASIVVAFPDTLGESGYGLDGSTSSATPHHPCSHSDLLTGTSIAASVVSAAAAAVWSYNVDLAAHEVMGVIYDNGVRTGGEADFCLNGPPCKEVRRVNLCQAVLETCKATSNPACVTGAMESTCLKPRSRQAHASAVPPFAGPFTSLPFPGKIFEVRGQPGRPTCPECKLIQNPGGIDKINWTLGGQIDPKVFSEDHVVQVTEPILRLFDEAGAILAERSGNDFQITTWDDASSLSVALDTGILLDRDLIVAKATMTWTLVLASSTEPDTYVVYSPQAL